MHVTSIKRLWAQLNLGYMTKQIYDNHKVIWWEHVNVNQSMTRDDFIWLQNIPYLNLKHKRGSWCLHTNLAISIWSWIFQHSKDVFFFQDAGEINGTQIPFTNSMWVHSIIWPQWCHFYGCHIWRKWYEIPFVHLDGVWWSLYECPFSVNHYK